VKQGFSFFVDRALDCDLEPLGLRLPCAVGGSLLLRARLLLRGASTTVSRCASRTLRVPRLSQSTPGNALFSLSTALGLRARDGAGSQSPRVAAPFAFTGLRRARVAGIQVGRAAPIHAVSAAVVAPTAADGNRDEQAYHQGSNNSHDFPCARTRTRCPHASFTLRRMRRVIRKGRTQRIKVQTFFITCTALEGVRLLSMLSIGATQRYMEKARLAEKAKGADTASRGRGARAVIGGNRVRT
jgi:hypothetical protein